MVAKAIGNPRQSWGYADGTAASRRSTACCRCRAAACSAVVHRSTAWCISAVIRANTMNGSSPAGVTPICCPISSDWRTTRPHTRRQRRARRSGQCHRYPKAQSADPALPRRRRFTRPAALRGFQRRRPGGIRPAAGGDPQRAARVRRYRVSESRATSAESEDRHRGAGHPRGVRGAARDGRGDRAGRRAQHRAGPSRSHRRLRRLRFAATAAALGRGRCRCASIRRRHAAARSACGRQESARSPGGIDCRAHGQYRILRPLVAHGAARRRDRRAIPAAAFRTAREQCVRGQWLHAFEAGSRSPRSADHLHAGASQCQRPLAAARAWFRHHLRERAAGQPRQRRAEQQRPA